MTPAHVEYIKGLVKARRVEVSGNTVRWVFRRGFLFRSPDGLGGYTYEVPGVTVSSIDAGPYAAHALREAAGEIEVLQRVVDGWTKRVGRAEACEETL